MKAVEKFIGPNISYVLISHETVIPEPGKLYSQHVVRLLISLLSWLCFSARVQSHQIQVFCGCNKILLQWTKRNVHINQHEVDLVEFSHVSLQLWRQAKLQKVPRVRWEQDFREPVFQGETPLMQGLLRADPLHIKTLAFCSFCFFSQEELGPCLQGQPLRHESNRSLKN